MPHRENGSRHSKHGSPSHGPETKSQGVNVNPTGDITGSMTGNVAGGADMQYKYTSSDVDVLLHHSHCHNWDECISWLEKSGEKDRDLTPGESRHMAEDLRSLKQSSIPFNSNPKKVFDLMHKQHGH
jgi:hypothetical protein